MDVKLTQYSRGSGCGCKIAPAMLEEILKSQITQPDTDKLLVGNSSKDDAAVYDMGNGMALISTTDFFMPIVDDAYDYGCIASANAISDVYAMGGTPLMALAILGWPVDKIPTEYAQKIMEGSRSICREAGIPLAGGHSIDSVEPIFGLSVSGIVPIANLKKNNAAKENDYLFLTKPIGTGILSAAMKRGVLVDAHQEQLIVQMTQLNSIGAILGNVNGVNAMTDVTGFGLLGHLIEMCDGSNLSAEIYYNNINVCNGTRDYIAQGVMPDATFRNWNSYSKSVSFDKGVNMTEAFSLLPDPQTNGGLLISVSAKDVDRVKELFVANKLEGYVIPIGRLVSRQEKAVFVGIDKRN